MLCDNVVLPFKSILKSRFKGYLMLRLPLTKEANKMIKDNNEFTTTLVNAMANKAQADFALQECAVFAINQSIQHNNIDCGLRIVKNMQESKYGNLKAMVTYLVKFGQFAVEKQKLIFHKDEAKQPIQGTMATTWLTFGKTEAIEVAIDDKYVMEAIQRLLTKANKWAKQHNNKVSNETLNKLTEIIQPKLTPFKLEEKEHETLDVPFIDQAA